jgi:hypothetical protein
MNSLSSSEGAQPVLPVTERMQLMVDRWQTTADARAIFLNCYLLMTRNMIKAVEAGEFYDATWVSELLHRFAEFYFDALVLYEQDPDAAPSVWRITHQAAAQHELLTIQNLMLGVNAHINYDLVLAVVEMLEHEWPTLTPNQRHQRYADHRHVNEVIARTINSVQDEVICRLAPAFYLIDRASGPLDEWLTERLICQWRDTVWHYAERFLNCETADERETLRLEVEQSTLQCANTILLTENIPLLRSLF